MNPRPNQASRKLHDNGLAELCRQHNYYLVVKSLFYQLLRIVAGAGTVSFMLCLDCRFYRLCIYRQSSNN